MRLTHACSYVSLAPAQALWRGARWSDGLVQALKKMARKSLSRPWSLHSAGFFVLWASCEKHRERAILWPSQSPFHGPLHSPIFRLLGREEANKGKDLNVCPDHDFHE